MNRPRSPLVFLLLAIFFSTGVSLTAQLSPRPNKGPTPVVDFEQFAVYWTAEAGWRTELLLRNNLPSQSLTVTPALRTADGAETALPAVTIGSDNGVTLDLNSTIAVAAPQLIGAYGSIVLRYTAPVIK